MLDYETFAAPNNVRVEVPAGAPLITINPLPQTLKLGTNVSFTVAATGLPAPGYQWSLNGTNILDATNTSYAIAFVAATNTGNYSVIATNLAGFATGSDAALALLPPVAAHLGSISVQPDGTVQISFAGDAVWNYMVELKLRRTSRTGAC